MKQLTRNEIKFVKETGFTPTVYQCDEYYRTIFTDEHIDISDKDYASKKEAYSEKWYKVASDYAKEKYGIDLNVFIDKNISIENDDYDGISLEYVATYLFYCFFTKDELEKLTDKEATEFLKNYRYYCGFRKWDNGNLTYVQEAIEAYNGDRLFYLQDDGNVWNTRQTNINNNSYFKDKVILVKPILD